jgi:multisubunit Na+/H+ antiporter MnhB subunit
MTSQKPPYSRLAYFLAIVSCMLFFFGGVAIIFALIAYYLAKKALTLNRENPGIYPNIRQIKKARVFAIIGIVLNLIIVVITIWTLYTIGWEAWSDEFVRKWNEGLQNRQSF